MQKRPGKFSSTQSMRFTIIMLATSVLKSFTALACIIGLAVCCCLPSIIAILYAVPDQVMKGTPYWMAPEIILHTGHSLTIIGVQK